MTRVLRQNDGFSVIHAFNEAKNAGKDIKWDNNIEIYSFKENIKTHKDISYNYCIRKFRNTVLDCNPFIKIEIRGNKSFNPVSGETKPIKDNLYSNNIHFENESIKLELNDKLNNLTENYFIVIQVLDADELNDNRIIGESVLLFNSYDINKDNYIKCDIFDALGNECGNIILKSYMRDNNVFFNVLGIQELIDLQEGFTFNETEKNKWFYDLMLFFIWLAYFLISVIIYKWIEGYKFWLSLYFRFVTAFTIGYGDIYPNTNPGKLITALFIVIDTITLGVVTSKIMYYFLIWREKKRLKSEKEIRENIKQQKFAKETAKIDKARRKIYKTTALVVGYVIIGTLVFIYVEGLAWYDAFEWNFVTLSTVGYGYNFPETIFGQTFTCIYIATGVYVLVEFAGSFFDYYDEKKRIQYQLNVYKRTLVSKAQLFDFDKDGDSQIDRFEFLTKMLIETDQCSEEQINEIMYKFNKIDTDGSKYITTDELKFAQQNTNKAIRAQFIASLTADKTKTKKCCGLC